jgi:tetratricopeptide (TPR) repeat protein
MVTSISTTYWNEKLAKYFETKQVFLNKTEPYLINTRKVVEQPWQLKISRRWTDLAILMKDINFFKAAWQIDNQVVYEYWALVEMNSEFKIIDVYNSLVKKGKQINDLHYSYVLAQILEYFGHKNEAQKMYDDILGCYKEEDTRYLADKDKIEIVLNFLKSNEKINFNEEIGLFINLNFKKANIQKDLGNYKEALKIYTAIEDTVRLTDHPPLPSLLINKAAIFMNTGRYNEASKLLDEAEQLAKINNEYDTLGDIKSNKAMIHMHQHNYSEAKKLFEDALKLNYDYNDEEGKQNTLGNLANIYLEEGNFDKAIEYLRIKEKKCRELGKKQSLQVAIGNIALVLQRKGNLNEALNLLNEQEQICTEIQHSYGLAHAYTNKALVINLMGNPDEAMEYAIKAKQLILNYHIVDLEKSLDLILRDIYLNFNKNIKNNKEITFDERNSKPNWDFKRTKTKLPWWKKFIHFKE